MAIKEYSEAFLKKIWKGYMTSYEREFIESLTPGEKKLIDFLTGKSSLLQKNIFETIAMADIVTFVKLEKIFPEECAAWVRYKSNYGWWQTVCVKAGIDG